MAELIDIAVHLKHQTDKAYLVETGEGDMWLAKSLVEYYAENKVEIITMPYWLAKEKGLI